jgi:hypothetical protein
MCIKNECVCKLYILKFKNMKKEQVFDVMSAKYKVTMYYQSLYLPTDVQESCFKGMLKFTLKQLLRVSVRSP